MTTITKFLDLLAIGLSEQQDMDANVYVREWCFRGTLPNDEVDENKTLLAVLHCTSQDEVVKFNHTLRLDCNLTGTILIGEMTTGDVQDEVMKIFSAAQLYFKSLAMQPIEDAILLQAIAHGVQTEIDGYYMSFTIPVEIYAQF